MGRIHNEISYVPYRSEKSNKKASVPEGLMQSHECLMTLKRRVPIGCSRFSMRFANQAGEISNGEIATGPKLLPLAEDGHGGSFGKVRVRRYAERESGLARRHGRPGPGHRVQHVRQDD